MQGLEGEETVEAPGRDLQTRLHPIAQKHGYEK